MRTESPLCLYTGAVLPAWIDYNGHMNVAYYVLAFDHASDALMDYLGMDAAYRQRENCSAFVVETHVNYQRELLAGDPLRITTQLLGFDKKRLHFFHRMYHAVDGFLAATTEIMAIHVNLRQRHGAAMPAAIMERLYALHTQHGQLPRPAQSGRVIGVRTKAATAGVTAISASVPRSRVSARR